MSYYKPCPRCGAHLDPGEVCDCGAAQSNNERFNAMSNGWKHPHAICAALLALGRAGLLDKEKAAPGATNTKSGRVEQTLTGPVSASNDTKETEEMQV